jgi:hypothetical protein
MILANILGPLLPVINNYIYGSIFKLHHSEENLRIIDDYEGYGPEQDQPNLYTRLLVLLKLITTFWMPGFTFTIYRLMACRK